MAQGREMTPEAVSRLAGLHGIALDPGRLEVVARDLEVSVAKMEEVDLTGVEPAYIGPMQLKGARGRV